VGSDQNQESKHTLRVELTLFEWLETLQQNKKSKRQLSVFDEALACSIFKGNDDTDGSQV